MILFGCLTEFSIVPLASLHLLPGYGDLKGSAKRRPAGRVAAFHESFIKTRS